MSLIAPNVTDEQREQEYIATTKLLDERIKAINTERMQKNLPTLTDTLTSADKLTDIEHTHILFQAPTCTITIPQGKIYMDRINSRKGTIPFLFGDANNAQENTGESK